MEFCKICSNGLTLLKDFGSMPIANAFVRSPHEDRYRFDLELGLCESCSMVQLVKTVPPEKMFHSDYQFKSSTSKIMKRHFQNHANRISDLTGKSGLIVELGCNDGVLLQWLLKKGRNHLGVEPSSNVAELAQQKGIHVKNAFFNEESADEILQEYGQADIICGFNVMCHIENLNAVFAGFQKLLKDSGQMIFEDPYLGAILEKTSFDQIYDEHVYYFSVHSMKNLAGKHGFSIVHAEEVNVHGGSIRFILKKGKNLENDAVKKLLVLEDQMSVTRKKGFETFSKKIDRVCFQLKDQLGQIKKEGNQIVGYGATSKSTTLLNYAEIGPDLVDYICDTTPSKIGKLTPGTHIPIKSYETFLQEKPSYALLLAWNHFEEIIAKEEAYLEQGGSLIIPFPEVRIYETKTVFN